MSDIEKRGWVSAHGEWERMNNPILKALDTLLDDQEQRHAWLFEAGEKIRRWKEEELANAASQHRAGAPSGLSPSVSGKAAHRISQGKDA